jgi:nicotinate-nucleotide adenylyltransferase
MRIALFGGTFDPVHHGHLILARDAIEQLKLDHVIFIPAALSPHKPGTVPAAPALRCEMLAAAIAGEDQFLLDECELHRAQPSYTIDTVQLMRERFPGAELFYLIGRDHLQKLDTWQRIDQLRQLVQFIVFNRGAADSADTFSSLARRLDISATEIRQRVARGDSIRYLLPPAVEMVIARHNLYQETPY